MPRWDVAARQLLRQTLGLTVADDQPFRGCVPRTRHKSICVFPCDSWDNYSLITKLQYLLVFGWTSQRSLLKLDFQPIFIILFLLLVSILWSPIIPNLLMHIFSLEILIFFIIRSLRNNNNIFNPISTKVKTI